MELEELVLSLTYKWDTMNVNTYDWDRLLDQ
jgi:hypothetical protein